MNAILTGSQAAILDSVLAGDTPILWTPDLIHYESDVRHLCALELVVRTGDDLVLTPGGREAAARRRRAAQAGAATG